MEKLHGKAENRQKSPQNMSILTKKPAFWAALSPIRGAFLTAWETTNPMARKRRLPHRRWLTGD
jgi:hypothetical protein